MSRVKPITIALFVCVVFVALTTCGKESPTSPTAPTTSPPPPPSPVATSITITPVAATLSSIGQAVQLSAMVRDQNNNTMPGASVSWLSANTEVATVSSQGLVTAVMNGVSQVTARSGNASAQATITVSAPVPNRAPEPVGTIAAQTLTVGEPPVYLDVSGSFRDPDGDDLKYSASSTDESVATAEAVPDSGIKIHPVSMGSATVAVTATDPDSLSAAQMIAVTVMEPHPDRAALVVLYNATNGANWTENTNWLSDRPLGEWYGVDTDEAGRVSSLSLPLNQLSGPLPEEIGHLTELTLLILHSNQLSGSLPEEVGKLTNLTFLNLSINQLSGPLPLNLIQLGDLKTLRVGDTGLCAPIDAEFQAWLGMIPEHDVTACGGVILDRAPLVAFYNATNGENWSDNTNWLSDKPLDEWYGIETNEAGRVSSLTLPLNQLSGPLPAEIGNLSDLTFLILWENRLSGQLPSEIGNLTKLKFLNLAENQLSGPLPLELTQLVALQLLNVEGTDLCTPTGTAFQAWLSTVTEHNATPCADVVPGLAPMDQEAFDELVIGKILSTESYLIEFLSQGRFVENISDEGGYSYSIINSSIGLLTQNYDDDRQCVVELTFTERINGINGTSRYSCGGDTEFSQPEQWRFTETRDPDSYDIEIVWVGDELAGGYRAAFDAAVDRWERVITANIEDEFVKYSISEATIDDLFENGDTERIFGYVDDIRIYVRVGSLDGEGNTLAQATPFLNRDVTQLPIFALMDVDTDDLAIQSPQALEDLILHEMAHALGFGTTIWEDLDLLENPSIGPSGEPISPSPDTHFTGMNAVSAFDASGGESYEGGKVPVENEIGGAGSQDGHWRESVFGPNFIMAPVAYNDSYTTPQPLTLITIQSMADLGYTVDVSQADPYMIPTSDEVAAMLATTAGIGIPRNCRVNLFEPIRIVDDLSNDIVPKYMR